MIRTVFKKQDRSAITMWIYFLLMGISYLCLHFSTYYFLGLSGSNFYVLLVNKATFIVTLVLCLVVWAIQPGYLEKSPKFDWVTMLEQFECSSLCPDCCVLKTPRSRHCNLCNRCIDRFDHHCPWVNNCIGRRNFNWFYAFVLAQSAFLLTASVASVYYSYLDLFTDYLTENQIEYHSLGVKARRVLAICFALVSVFFYGSVMFLCYIQTGNLLRGKTMPERFSSQSQ